MAQECYAATLKGKESKEALVIDDMENRDNVQLEQTVLVEDLEELNIDPNCPEWVIHVRRALLEEFKLYLKKTLDGLQRYLCLDTRGHAKDKPEGHHT